MFKITKMLVVLFFNGAISSKTFLDHSQKKQIQHRGKNLKKYSLYCIVSFHIIICVFSIIVWPKKKCFVDIVVSVPKPLIPSPPKQTNCWKAVLNCEIVDLWHHKNEIYTVRVFFVYIWPVASIAIYLTPLRSDPSLTCLWWDKGGALNLDFF